MNQQITQVLVCYLAFINILTCVIYGIDKQKARSRQWRVPEKTLLLLAVAGGSAGACIGMRIFHHKTQKWKFKLGVPLMMLVQMILAALIFCRGL